MMSKHIPNFLTVLRILVTPFFIYCVLVQGLEFIAFVLFALASVTDWYDGYLARRYGLLTDWGKFLDPLADKILVVGAFSTFVYIGVVKLWMVAVIVSRDLIVTWLRSAAMRRGKPMVTSVFGKVKTLLQMLMISLVLIFLSLQPLSAFFSGALGARQWFTEYYVIYSGMLFVTFLTAFSGLFYLYENRDSLTTLLPFYRHREI